MRKSFQLIGVRAQIFRFFETKIIHFALPDKLQSDRVWNLMLFEVKCTNTLVLSFFVFLKDLLILPNMIFQPKLAFDRKVQVLAFIYQPHSLDSMACQTFELLSTTHSV